MNITKTCSALAASAAIVLALPALSAGAGVQRPDRRADAPEFERIPGARPRNVIFILADDHRYDAMGFMGHPFLQTPAMDAMARNGVHVKNAFVTTALCSPSRASILTGLYAHRHRVIDNNNPVPEDLIFFPQYLQKAGYQTAFVGKWHMGGDSDAPNRGFDRWVSFRGQGSYLPAPAGLNVDGKKTPQRGYITDELTDYSLDWLRQRNQEKPFFLYLSHKGVHAQFVPAERHKGSYAGAAFRQPETMANTPDNYRGKPMWVFNQRNSWHGVDFPYHSRLDISKYYRDYCETLRGVDDSIGRVMSYLRENNLLESTLVVYMGDNGFLFGEHGLIDKRCAYEESMRVPMLVHCPELTGPRRGVEQVIANIDVAPTILEAAGIRGSTQMDGRSFLPLLRGETTKWRDGLLYEYYWERDFPQTPTQFAIRTDDFKYIRYHGIWDTDELYDMRTDPREKVNLIRDPQHLQTVRRLNQLLFRELRESSGLQMPLLPDRHLGQQNLRNPDGPPAAQFPLPFFGAAPGNQR